MDPDGPGRRLSSVQRPQYQAIPYAAAPGFCNRFVTFGERQIQERGAGDVDVDFALTESDQPPHHQIGFVADTGLWGHSGHTLPLLDASGIDQVSVECAASGVDVSVIQHLTRKRLMLGVISVSTDDVESPEIVGGRIRAGLEYCDPERLMPCTDCGLVPRPRQVANAKMEALGAGTALVRNALGSSSEAIAIGCPGSRPTGPAVRTLRS